MRQELVAWCEATLNCFLGEINLEASPAVVEELAQVVDAHAKTIVEAERADLVAALRTQRDEFYAALIVMRNYYGGAISRAAVDEILERGWKFIKKSDEALAHADGRAL